MAESRALPALAALVRQRDPDRYLTALFAPDDRRDGLFALGALNFEVAKTREAVTEPMLGQIRLQWWRDAVEEIYAGKPVRRHETAQALADAVRRYGLTRYHVDRIIDARELDLTDDPPRTLAVLERYCEDTAARLLWLALEVLGVRDSAAAVEASREVGIAWALTGLIRAIPFHARDKRLYIPVDLAAEADLHTGDLFELRPSAPLAKVVGRLRERAEAHLDAARAKAADVPAAARPALLLGVLADGYLARIRRAGDNVFDLSLGRPDGWKTLRLSWAAFRGRY
ncbi:MAG TPA: phytoene/squalene synthase family protein [Stellaceae bacterium]